MLPKSILLFVVLLGSFNLFTIRDRSEQVSDPHEIRLNEAEREVFRLVNEYRIQQHLSPVKFSPSLSYVAWWHVRDLAENLPASERCNLHSWSDKGPWTSCCYTEDHQKASCMWSKPRELTNYKADGYEIAYWTNATLYPNEFAEKAVRGWKRSLHHNEVMVNLGIWQTADWKAMGVACYKGYAVVWFGEEPDDAPLASE